MLKVTKISGIKLCIKQVPWPMVRKIGYKSSIKMFKSKSFANLLLF